jgi:hypothetical protein
MFSRLRYVLLGMLPSMLLAAPEPMATEGPSQDTKPAKVASIVSTDLAGFGEYPKKVKALVESSLALTRLELTYTFGSHEPQRGGMDCSGAIYHVIHFNGITTVPRSSVGMASWLKDKNMLQLTPATPEFDSPEMQQLKPGDLVFWTHTWETAGRGDGVSHVMLYLGKHKATGKRLLFGSSDGRTYGGEPQRGVSIFDFTLPKPGGKACLYGYGPIPGIGEAPVLLAKPTENPKPPVAPTLSAKASEIPKLAAPAAKPKDAPKKAAAQAPAETIRKAQPTPASPHYKPSTKSKSPTKPKPTPQLDPKKMLKDAGDAIRDLLR